MKKQLLTLSLFIGSFFCTTAQTQFWSDTFEDTGAPSSGSRNPSVTFYASNERYFDRITPAQANWTNILTGIEGAKFFGGADIDNLSGQNTQSPYQNIMWSSINISGKSGMSFKGLFATGTSNNFDHFPGLSPTDHMLVEYRIDGGAWTSLVRFFPNIANSGAGALALETTGDSLAQGEGPALNGTFTEFSANIVGTGSLLDLRFECEANGTSFEEIGIDNFRLFEAPACSSPTLNLSAQANVSCNGGSNGSATMSASGGAPYTYTWSPSGGNAASATGLTAGVYTCVTTNSCGLTASKTVTITQPTALTVNAASQINISCNGGSNGAASVSVSGGTTAYSYNWTPGNPTGDGTASVTGLTAGTWTCTVTDGNSCVATRTFNITQPTALTVNAASQTNISCNGGSNGAASVSVSGGTTAYSYNWTPGNPTGDGSASVTGLTAGTWTCTVTDGNSCVSSATFNITQPTALTVNAASQTNISCNGGSNGAASVSVSGGTTAYSYNWTPGNPTGDGTASVTGLTAGNWTCTVTDGNSCVATRTFNITQPSALTVNAASQTNISCNAGSNGAASVSVSGGTTAYSYNWTPGNPTGDGSASVSNLTAGNWTCTVTDGNSCVSSATFNITQPTALTVNAASQTNISCNAGSNGAASVSVSGGTTAYSYNWTPGNPTGDGSASVSNLTAGNWTCTVTDGNSCVSSATFNITQPTALVATTSQTNITCNGSSNGIASVSASGGTGTLMYSWLPTGGSAATATGLSNGNYTCTIIDANSCSIVKTFSISQPVTLGATSSQTNLTCYGGTNAEASVNVTGGTTPYSYTWSPSGGNSSLASNLSAGSYTCLIKDANNCTASKTVTITQPAAITASISSTPTGCSGNTGTATLSNLSGGTGPYDLSWVPGGSVAYTITGLNAGAYTCLVQDANMCVGSFSVTVTTAAGPTLNAVGQSNVLCNGGANGTATVSTTGGAGPYSYNWTPGNPTGDGTASVTGLTAGNWTCTVTDANSCVATRTFNITQPSALTVNAASQTNVACNAGSNGAASVSVSGGTTAYSYNWTPGNPTGDGTASVSNLTAGSYTCTVTDANSCAASQVFTITAPSALVANSSAGSILCNGANTTLTVSATGGSPVYTGIGTFTIAAGVHSYTVTDNNGCTATTSISVTQPAVLSASITAGSILCNGANTTLTVSALGGTPAYTGTGTFTAIAGTHSYTVSDNNGCTATTSITVSEPSVLSVNAVASPVLCHGANTTLTVTASGGTPAYTGTGTYTVTAGTYSYTVTDNNGCMATVNKTVNEPTAISMSILTQSNVTCHSGFDGSVEVTSSGGTGTLNYSWTPSGPPSESNTNLTAGQYTCYVIDDNSCRDSISVTITEPAAITASQSITLCSGQSLVIGANTYTSSGTYVDVLQSQINGCDSTLTTMLNVLPAVTHTQNITVCFGEIITVGTNNYNSSGTYTDVLTATNGCDSTVTTVLVVNPAVDVTTTQMGLVLSANASSATYQWINCDNANQPIAGETNQSFTALTNGNYAVIVTQNSCSDTSACMNVSTVGLTNLNASNKLMIYPNPAKNSLTISGLQKNSVVEVYNTLGQIQLKTIADEETISMAIDHLTDGIYIIKVKSDKKEYSLRFIKQQ